MFDNPFPPSANLQYTSAYGNAPNPVSLPENTSNDVSEFFENYNMIYVQRISFQDISKSYVYINLSLNSHYPQPIIIENPEKNLNYKYIFNFLENRGIFLKSTIPQTKIVSKKKELTRKIQQLASSNHHILPSKAGLFLNSQMVVSIACSNFYPIFYNNSYININLNSLNVIKVPKINFCSFDGVFLLVLRYMSLMMPLSLPVSSYSFNIRFPYILTFSSQSSINALNNLLRSYLLIFRNSSTSNLPESIAVNSPFNQLNTIIQSRINNVLLINGLVDTENIRNKNLNLLKDYFTQNYTDHLCCIISNTVQLKLSDTSYINISFDKIINNNPAPDFHGLDSVFIQWITSTPIDAPFYMQYNEIFDEVFNKYAKNITNINTQQAISTLISVFIFIRRKFVIHVDNCPDNELADKFFNYLMSFFESHSKEENNSAVLEQFKSNINNMIYNRQLHVLPNDKTNKTLPYQALNRLIYKGNSTIIITDEVLRYICEISNINIFSLKKSLVHEGYIYSSESLNVSKISLYPPGSPSVRQYAYIIDDSIIVILLKNKTLRIAKNIMNSII